jgi:NAD(P)-dependent dehydrogenase (short-subunit alcohol dehydrogenase family)
MDLEGRVAVVTGASSGIGWATALAFAREAAQIVVAARRMDRLEQLVALIGNMGGTALAVECDVGEWDQVQALASGTKERFGRADVLVNNAGVPGGGPFHKISIEQAERITRVNYFGVLYGTKAFLPMMLEAGRGHIVNVASLAGRFAVPGASLYTATKHAVVAFSEALHYELAPKGILVTAVNPALVRTETFPHRDARDRGPGVPMAPERVAEVIVRAVKRGTAPEVSVPRWLSSLQAVRVVMPPLYRFGMRLATRGGLRATSVNEAESRPER